MVYCNSKNKCNSLFAQDILAFKLQEVENNNILCLTCRLFFNKIYPLLKIKITISVKQYENSVRYLQPEEIFIFSYY